MILTRFLCTNILHKISHRLQVFKIYFILKLQYKDLFTIYHTKFTMKFYFNV